MYACHYAVMRFRPYAETGEFVNCAVVLACPEAGFFECKLDLRHRRRVGAFFPELDPRIFRAAMAGMRADAERLRRTLRPDLFRAPTAEDVIAAFRSFAKPRESLVTFGEPGVLLAEDPAEALATVYGHQVERQFVRGREYQEALMRREVGRLLRECGLADRYRRNFELGDERFRVPFPFVCVAGDRPIKAIRPIDLLRAEPTDVYRHGDQFLTAIRRLRGFGHLPQSLVLPVQLATQGPARQAGEDIARELEQEGAAVLPIEDRAALSLAAAIPE